MTHWLSDHPLFERVAEHLGFHPDAEPPHGRKTVTMSIAQIEKDIREAVTNADGWVHDVLEKHLPGLAKLQDDPIVQALEAAVLPPTARVVIAEFVSKLAAEFAQPADQAAQPAAPAEQPTQA